MASILAVLFVTGMSLVGMIYGWGLQPENWGWVTVSYMSLIVPTFIAEIKG